MAALAVMAPQTHGDRLDYMSLAQRFLARIAAAQGRGAPVLIGRRAANGSPAWGPTEEAAENEALLLAIKAMMDRADEAAALRQRNRALNYVEDELASTVRTLREDDDITQDVVTQALCQRLAAAGVDPTELDVDVSPDAGDLWLRHGQGFLHVVLHALSPHVQLRPRTLWDARAHEGLPLATVGGRYISNRVVRQLANEIAAAGGPTRGVVTLGELGSFDRATSGRVSEAIWEQFKEYATNPALYSAVLRSNKTFEGWEEIRSRLESRVRDATAVVVLTVALLAWGTPRGLLNFA